MSKIGMKHLSQNPYGALAFGKGALTSSTSPLWSPQGAYNFGDGGQYMLGANTTSLSGMHYGEADATAEPAPAADTPASNGSTGKADLMDHLKNPWILGILVIGGYMLYKNSQGAKKASNPRRRKRNGTRKGMARKGARRGARLAYDALPKKRKSTKRRRRNASAHQNRAKKAMNLYHSGKARSLKAAWKMV